MKINVVEPHPKGSNARILLSSVFGPYAQDDEFGSRSINPMELYHNQVTRAQGSFSLRMFHRSWGIMMIQENISAPCSVLDFPTRETFARELTANKYDIVGISSIIVNVGKVREMCRLVRELSPDSVIVVGGHVAAISGLENMIDADHIVRGDAGSDRFSVAAMRGGEIVGAISINAAKDMAMFRRLVARPSRLNRSDIESTAYDLRKALIIN